MKRTLRLLLSVLLLLCLMLSVCAAEQFSEEYYRIADETETLDSVLIQDLDQYIIGNIERLQCDFFVAADDISGQGSTMKEYSDATYRACGFGYGQDGTCVSLIIDLPARDCELFYYGGIENRFTTAQSDRMLDAFVEGFTSGGLPDGVRSFLTEAFRCAEEMQNTPADPSMATPAAKQIPAKKLLISLMVGLIVGLIAAAIYTNALKKKMVLHPATDADRYVVPGSFKILDSRERYEYSVITKTPRQTNRSGGSGHSSGSGVSGGSRHF